MKIAKIDPYDPYSPEAPPMPEDPTQELKNKFQEALAFARQEELLKPFEAEELWKEIKKSVEMSEAFSRYEEEKSKIDLNEEFWDWKQELLGHLSRIDGIIDQLRERGTPLDVGSIMAEMERLGLVNSEDFPELYDQAMQKVREYVANRQ